MSTPESVWIGISFALAVAAVVPYFRKHRRKFADSYPSTGVMVRRLTESFGTIYSLKIIGMGLLTLVSTPTYANVHELIGTDAVFYWIVGCFAIDYGLVTSQLKAYDNLGKTERPPDTQSGD